jgi:hypothetical protein
MKKFSSLSVIALFTMLAAISLGYASQATSKGPSEQALQRKVSLPELVNLPTTSIVVRGLSTAGVPGGIVTVPACEERARAVYIPQGATLRNVLDSAISSDPEYMWDVEGGVVNLLPRGGEPAFLKLRVRQFKAEEIGTPNEALDQLLATPEVKSGVQDPAMGVQVFRGGIGFYGSDENGGRKFSVNVENATVRETLNAIVRAQGKAVWAYTQQQCNGTKSFSIDFLVR